MNENLFSKDFLSKLNSRNNFDLFGVDIREDIHWGKLFIHLFGEYYSRYRIKQKVNHAALNKALISRYSLGQDQIIRVDHAIEDKPAEVNHEFSEVLLILKRGFFFVTCNELIEIMYGPEISEEERNEVINLVDEFKIIKVADRKFYMVEYSMGCFDLADFDVKPFDIDIETHYNEDFQNIHSIISNSLTSKDKNGLILLHGKYGSGKTYYLRHLISKIERKFIYLPLNMIETINTPEFLPFISRQPNSILILEDCESILVPRESGCTNASALSNLLNLGDGLLSDALSINVICTFNAGIKKIDDAILRKGRLLARYEFKELELPKAQTLANKIGKNVKIENPMTVSEIYNLDDESFENEPAKVVGFKAA